MDFRLPEMGEGLYEVEVVQSLVEAGRNVRPGDGLLQVLTDKATMEVPSPFAGTVQRWLVQAGDKISIGTPILSYQPAHPEFAGAVADTPAMTVSIPMNRATVNAVSSRIPAAAPSVRHLARKLKIDLTTIRGTGPGGRILLDDLPMAAPSAPSAPPAKATALDIGEPGTRVKLHGIRRTIAEHMVSATHIIPHYAYVDECDLSDLVRLRDSLKESVARHGVKLTYLAFFVKAASLALREVPIVNSSLDDEAGEIVFHSHYHIGIAVATSRGLMVPVVHDVDRKDVYTVAREIDHLSNLCRAGQARREDFRGGTFTVTSIGGVGGLISTPIIHHPEVGILGLGKVVKRPVYDHKGDIRPAEMMYLSYSFDHRVVDGAVGAMFGNALMRHISNPASLLLPDSLR